MTIFSLLASLFNRIMSLFLPPNCNKQIQNGLRVDIKYGKSKVVSLNIQPHWTVKEVKEHLEKELNVPAGQLKIIFAGKQLDDSLQIQECDVGNHTILNAVCAKQKSSSELSNNQIDKLISQTEIVPEETQKCVHPLVESVLRLQHNDEQRSDIKHNDPKKVHFFVYCSNTKCNKICPGKLRVRCAKCKQGTLTVNKDPDCWDDVLNPLKINGVCHSENCDGNFAEFYFKCASYHQQDNSTNLTNIEEEKCIPLQHIKNNFKAVPCLACTEISQVVLVFPCEQGHVICLDCFRDFCSSRLQERSFALSENYGYTLSCPIQCENSFISEPHHFKLLDQDQYERFQKFGAEECLLAAGGVLCPQIGCGEGIIPDPDCKRITCVGREQGGHGCGFVFCRICLQGYHIGECVEEYLSDSNATGKNDFFVDGAQGETSRWEETASKNTIKGTTKPCPKCRTPTEKDGGCMHMVCSRPQCCYHWCWVCQSEWTRECMGAHWFA